MSSIRLSRVPEPGEKIDIGWGHPSYHRERMVISVSPYTGRYPDLFTHVVRFHAPWLANDYGERLIKVEPEGK